MIKLLTLLWLMASVDSQADSLNSQNAQQHSTPENQSERRIIQVSNSPDSSDGSQNQPGGKTPSEDGDRCTGWSTFASIGLLIVGSVQVGLFCWQLNLIRASIKDSTSSVKALENIALSIQENARRQSRAYLSVPTGDHYPQNEAEKRFEEVTMGIKNHGFTPASEVNFKIRLDILDYPLPEEFSLATQVRQLAESCVIAAQHQHTMRAVMTRYISALDRTAFRKSETRALYVWGRVEYKDIFGDRWFTEFCQVGAWTLNGNFNTFAYNRGNKTGKID